MCLPKILFPVFMFAVIFFTAAHFHLAANISHFLAAAMKFSCFSSNEIRLLAPSLSIKNNVEKDTTLLLFFFSL